MKIDGITVSLEGPEEIKMAQAQAAAVPSEQIEAFLAEYNSMPVSSGAKPSFLYRLKHLHGLRFYNLLNLWTSRLFGVYVNLNYPFIVRKQGYHDKGTEKDMKKYENEAYGTFESSKIEVIGMKKASLYFIDGKLRMANDSEYRLCLFKRLAEEMDHLGIPKPISILEVGCGNCFNFQAMKAQFQGAKITGLDLNINRLRFGKRFYKDSLAGEIICGDGLHLPFPDKSFDVALTAHVMERFGNNPEMLERLVRELKRVSRYMVAVEPVIEDQDMFGAAHGIIASHPRNIAKIIGQNATILADVKRKFGNPVNMASIIISKS